MSKVSKKMVEEVNIENPIDNTEKESIIEDKPVVKQSIVLTAVWARPHRNTMLYVDKDKVYYLLPYNGSVQDVKMNESDLKDKHPVNLSERLVRLNVTDVTKAQEFLWRNGVVTEEDASRLKDKRLEYLLTMRAAQNSGILKIV